MDADARIAAIVSVIVVCLIGILSALGMLLYTICSKKKWYYNLLLFILIMGLIMFTNTVFDLITSIKR